MKIGNKTTSDIILGTFAMGGGTSWQDTTALDDELIQLMRDAYDLGITGYDTAPVYGTGRSERLLGAAIKDHREDVYISTKVCLNWRNTEGSFEYARDGYQVYRNFNRKSLIQDTYDSLKRLDTDYIDLMIVHRCPPIDCIKEVAETMNELKEKGLIKAVGLSNVGNVSDPIKVLDTYLKYGSLDLIQEKANILDRKNLDLLPYCEKHGIVFQNYGGLVSGALSGNINKEMASWKGDNRSGNRWFKGDNYLIVKDVIDQLTPIANHYDCSVPVLALSWLKAQSPCLSLLVGARRLSSIKDTLKVLDIHLSAEDIEALNEISRDANKRIKED